MPKFSEDFKKSGLKQLQDVVEGYLQAYYMGNYDRSHQFWMAYSGSSSIWHREPGYLRAVLLNELLKSTKDINLAFAYAYLVITNAGSSSELFKKIMPTLIAGLDVSNDEMLEASRSYRSYVTTQTYFPITEMIHDTLLKDMLTETKLDRNQVQVAIDGLRKTLDEELPKRRKLVEAENEERRKEEEQKAKERKAEEQKAKEREEEKKKEKSHKSKEGGKEEDQLATEMTSVNSNRYGSVST